MDELALKIVKLDTAIHEIRNSRYPDSPTPENWSSLVEEAKRILIDQLKTH